MVFGCFIDSFYIVIDGIDYESFIGLIYCFDFYAVNINVNLLMIVLFNELSNLHNHLQFICIQCFILTFYYVLDRFYIKNLSFDF